MAKYMICFSEYALERILHACSRKVAHRVVQMYILTDSFSSFVAERGSSTTIVDLSVSYFSSVSFYFRHLKLFY